MTCNERAKQIALKNKLEGDRLFKISRFTEVIKRTEPHKHEAYFEVIYLAEGAGFHWIDTQKFQITPFHWQVSHKMSLNGIEWAD